MNQRNETGIYLPLAARTVHTDSGVVKTNSQYKGIKIYILVTAFTGTSVTYTLADCDFNGSGAVFGTVLASAAIAAAAPTVPVVLTVYPGIEVTANIQASKVLGRAWKITSTGTITSVTSSVRYVLLP